MPSLPNPEIKLPSVTQLKLPSVGQIKLPGRALGSRRHRRSSANLVGLDVQPGLIAAVQASVNGSILAERAAALPLAPDTVREGEVIDADLLSDSLRELFDSSRLGKRVRVGVANQRTVMRTLELPPVTDRKELVAAVQFQAQDQVPMPLSNAVLDFHPLGIVDTPAGPRQKVVLVAAQRDMIERLLGAVRRAGLQPEGVDLSAFALIRSLHRADVDAGTRALYLNVDGLTNLAIAEGATCRFTRVVGGGLEGIASDLAERRGIPVVQARELLAKADLNAPIEPELDEHDVAADPQPATELDPAVADETNDAGEGADAALGEDATQPAMALSAEAHDALESSMSYSETVAAAQAAATAESAPPLPSAADVRSVLEAGIREISGEVRNSLDFHRQQDGGGEVSKVVLSGAALDLPGFAEALQASLSMEVHGECVGLADQKLADDLSTHRLSVAAGLCAIEAPQ